MNWFRGEEEEGEKQQWRSLWKHELWLSIWERIFIFGRFQLYCFSDIFFHEMAPLGHLMTQRNFPFSQSTKSTNSNQIDENKNICVILNACWLSFVYSLFFCCCKNWNSSTWNRFEHVSIFINVDLLIMILKSK